MKKHLIYQILIIFLMIILNGNCAKSENSIDYQEICPEIIEFQDVLNKNLYQYNEFLDMSANDLISELVKGDFKFNIKNFLNKVIRSLFREMSANVSILVELTVLAVLCAILKNIQSAFLSEEVSKIAFYVCYMVIISILLTCFNNSLVIAKNVINDMSVFMYAVVPILSNLMFSMGNIVSSNSLRPFMICIVQLMTNIIRNFSLPLIYFSTVLSILDNITDKVQISKLAELIKKVSNFSLGFILTVFIGVISIKATVGTTVDGLTSRTAKYMFGAFIPVVGKYLADATDSVIGCVVIIKNVIGIVSVFGILIVCLMPILKIFSLVVMLKIVDAVLEPIIHKRVSNCINEVSISLFNIMAFIFIIALMIVISITTIISIGVIK